MIVSVQFFSYEWKFFLGLRLDVWETLLGERDSET